MWDLVREREFNLYDLKRLDENLFKTMSDMQNVANQKRVVDSLDLSEAEKKDLIDKIVTKQNVSIEDYDMYFYNPQCDEIELVPGGADLQVTNANV